MRELNKVGYVYDILQWNVEEDVIEHLNLNPVLVNKTNLPKLKSYRMEQDNYEGVNFPIETIDGEFLTLNETLLIEIVKEIYNLPVNKIFLDAGSEIFYILTLKGV